MNDQEIMERVRYRVDTILELFANEVITCEYSPMSFESQKRFREAALDAMVKALVEWLEENGQLRSFRGEEGIYYGLVIPERILQSLKKEVTDRTL